MKTVLIANRKGGCGKSSVAVTLAAALANQGASVALADADPQQSSLRWLKTRSDSAAKIYAVDWHDGDDIGDLPKKVAKNLGKKDWLIIDAPGSMSIEHAQTLISEADAILIPILPSIFDIDSTKQFLDSINDIKRIRKGKVAVHLLANRIRSTATISQKLKGFFDELGQEPLAWISERSLYPQLAEEGLAIFDHTQKRYRDVQAQWQPVMDELMPKVASKYEDLLADATIPPSLEQLAQPSVPNDTHSKLSYRTVGSRTAKPVAQIKDKKAFVKENVSSTKDDVLANDSVSSKSKMKAMKTNKDSSKGDKKHSVVSDNLPPHNSSWYE